MSSPLHLLHQVHSQPSAQLHQAQMQAQVQAQLQQAQLQQAQMQQAQFQQAQLQQAQAQVNAQLQLQPQANHTNGYQTFANKQVVTTRPIGFTNQTPVFFTTTPSLPQ